MNFADNSISWRRILTKSFRGVGCLNQQTIQLWNQIWNAKVSTQNCRLYIQQTSLFFLLTVVADYLLGRLRHLKNNFKKTREISYKFKDNQRTTSTVDINAEPDHNSDPGISNGISNAPGYGQFFGVLRDRRPWPRTALSRVAYSCWSINSATTNNSSDNDSSAYMYCRISCTG